MFQAFFFVTPYNPARSLPIPFPALKMERIPPFAVAFSSRIPTVKKCFHPTSRLDFLPRPESRQTSVGPSNGASLWRIRSLERR